MKKIIIVGIAFFLCIANVSADEDIINLEDNLNDDIIISEVISPEDSTPLSEDQSDNGNDSANVTPIAPYIDDSKEAYVTPETEIDKHEEKKAEDNNLLTVAVVGVALIIMARYVNSDTPKSGEKKKEE